MDVTAKIRRCVLCCFLPAIVAFSGSDAFAQSRHTLAAPGGIRILEIQGKVEVLLKGTTAWSAAQTNQELHTFDQIHAASNSRAALHWSDESIVSISASTELEIVPPDSSDQETGLHLVRGMISFFHRDQPGRIHVITRGAMAGIEGTEFAMEVGAADTTTLSVIDGKVRFENSLATLVLTNGEQAVARPGVAPARTAGFIANNLLQWCFYYPAVLDPDELPLTAAEKQSLALSLTDYRIGDLPGALDTYPTGRPNTSESERVYHAAVLLAVGNVPEAEAALSSVTNHQGRPWRLSLALRQLIAAVKRQPLPAVNSPELASELLGSSYYEQSRADRKSSLQNALKLARQATKVSPQFGFAWARVAELEFSFGRTQAALDALDEALTLAPRNAQALALKGFIMSAQSKPKKAREWFDRAIAADSALGNAWLGRGIVRIHQGDSKGGREDLLIAAALEPRRAELRSYLGKAFEHAGLYDRAAKELKLAKQLDPNDPTPYLYSALLNQQDNRINDAIRDLEKSQSLNDNQSVYRSQLLLDQDNATRSANLAGIYQDAGMFDLSLREAGRAASMDYANYSAHLFLANSYEQLRDPNWSNLRYEAPATAEFWIANLLAPASAGWLSAIASEKPYSKLFDRNRLGVVSDTTYLQRGAWTERGIQYGTSDKFSYGFEAKYIFDPGQRPNNSIHNRDLNLGLKFQLTPNDSFFFNVDQNTVTAGDLNLYYKPPAKPIPMRLTGKANPDVFGGFHHEWAPGIHTLLFGAYMDDSSELLNTRAGHWSLSLVNGKYNSVRVLTDHNLVTIPQKLYMAEIQQVWETEHHTTVAGARYSWGSLQFVNHEWQASAPIGSIFAGRLGSLNPEPKRFPFEIASQDIISDYHHLGVYAYHDWQIFDPLKIFAGVAYDRLEQPAVVQYVPFTKHEKTTSQASPKAGFILTPLPNTVLRGAYTRLLSGFIGDSSSRIEPTEVAGFNQAYRSVIPDPVANDTSGSKVDIYNLSLEQKFRTGTYLAVSGELMKSKLTAYEGAYYLDASDSSTMDFPAPIPFRKILDYQEKSLTFSADQLLGRYIAIGGRYRLSQANLNVVYPDISTKLPAANIDPLFHSRQKLESLLQTANFHANWNHPSGLFLTFEANWYKQDNSGFVPAEPGDDFWQYNLWGGYRFFHRKAEVSVGVLNLADEDYQLEPLNFYNEMAHRRTVFARFLLSF